MTLVRCVIVELLRHDNIAIIIIIIVISITLILPVLFQKWNTRFHVFVHSVFSSGIKYSVLFISCILFVSRLFVYWLCLLVAAYNGKICENYLYLQGIFWHLL